jgi:predicted Rossmann fold nucleotide-binding protein DprA/Smf involved in DNA uptake
LTLRRAKLLGEFGNPTAIFNASLTTREAQHLSAAVAQAIDPRQPLSDAAKELAKARAIGCRLPTRDEPGYPTPEGNLRPRRLLHVRGNSELLKSSRYLDGWRPSPNVLVEEGLAPGERPLYELLSVDQSRHIDELVELSGPTSSEVLPALFDFELKGVVRQLPGKQFVKVLL